MAAQDFRDLSAYIQEGLRQDEEATTMDAISYLPTQVGAVRSAILGLKKKKNKWNLEIMENEEDITVRFEDILQVSVPKEHWEEFQEIFDSRLDNDAYLNLQTLIADSVGLTEETVYATRLDELKAKILEFYDCQEVQVLRKVVEKWAGVLGCKEDLTESIKSAIPLNSMEEWVENHISESLKEHEGDLGYLELRIAEFGEMAEEDELKEEIFPESKDFSICMTGARYRTVCEGISLIFEARANFNKDCSYSIFVQDSEAADNLEEACVNLERIGNVFYPRVGQMLAAGGVFESLKEVIEDIGENNEL